MPALPRSIATVCLSGALPDKLEAAARAGFDGVEIFDNDLLTFDGTPTHIRHIAEDLGLTVYLWQPFRDFEAMDPTRLPRNLERAERKLDVMVALGAPMMLACSNVQPGALNDDARAAADLHALAERAAARGLRVGYEALAWGRHVNRWRHSWRIVQRADHPALGLILDSFHVLAVGDDLVGLDQVPADKLFFVQIADAPMMSMDVLSWSRHYRNFPGQGQLPVAQFVAAVLDAGYDGPLSLEVFNDEMRAAPATLNARDGLRSLILVEAEARPAVMASALPSPASYGGFEFIEFAVDPPAHEELAKFLAPLGFVQAGHHRSKSVDLYRQGQVSMILNSEPDSAAAEHFHLHGPSVCAMAFRVDDAARACARAAALLSPPWHERTGAGEREIPAIRAPDGTLIFLIEQGVNEHTIYDDDFVLAPGPPPGGLLAIDHVAQALPAGRMDHFALFYKAVFGFVPEQLWELPDPFGLIRSRAMVSTDRSIRLPLNISQSRETETGRFVSSYAGAGVHHIALAAADIVHQVQDAMSRKAPMLAIPANYYDDLLSRLDIDEDLLARLKQLNLLYDRDEFGRLLSGLYHRVPRPVLHRDRAATRIPAIRRRQRGGAHGGTGPASSRHHARRSAGAFVASRETRDPCRRPLTSCRRRGLLQKLMLQECSFEPTRSDHVPARCHPADMPANLSRLRERSACEASRVRVLPTGNRSEQRSEVHRRPEHHQRPRRAPKDGDKERWPLHRLGHRWPAGRKRPGLRPGPPDQASSSMESRSSVETRPRSSRCTDRKSSAARRPSSRNMLRNGHSAFSLEE